MSNLRTAAQQALEALEICAVRQEHQWHGLQQVQIAKGSLRAALEQPEQEPVAWRFKRLVNQDFETDWVLTKYEPPNGVNVVAIEPLYTHPPRREWRGLTEEEIVAIFLLAPTQPAFARAIEAALKERNA